MDLKEKTKQKLKEGTKKADKIIQEHGVGSGYLSKAKNIQRSINVVMLLGAATAITGVVIWMFYSKGKK